MFQMFSNLLSLIKENKSNESSVHALWYAFANAKEDEDVEFRLDIAEPCGGSLHSSLRFFCQGNTIFVENLSFKTMWDYKFDEIKKKCIWKPCPKRMKYKFQLPCFGKESCHYCKLKFIEKKSEFNFYGIILNEAAYLLFGDFTNYDRFKCIG